MSQRQQLICGTAKFTPKVLHVSNMVKNYTSLSKKYTRQKAIKRQNIPNTNNLKTGKMEYTWEIFI